MKAQYVPLEFTAQTWPRVEKFVASALKYGHGDYTLDQARLLVCMGSWLLIVAVDDKNEIHGCATATFLNVSSDDYKAYQVELRDFIENNSDYSIGKGKNGGVGREDLLKK